MGARRPICLDGLGDDGSDLESTGVAGERPICLDGLGDDESDLESARAAGEPPAEASAAPERPAKRTRISLAGLSSALPDEAIIGDGDGVAGGDAEEQPP
eukprot:5605109-Pyramimonas_sp.AAC.1